MVRVLGLLLMFACTTLTARLLGPSEYGTYSTGLSLAILLATLAPLGTDRVLVKQLSLNQSPEAAVPEIALTHRCTLLVSGVLLGGCLLGAVLFQRVGPHAWSQAVSLAAILLVPLTLTYLRQWVAIPLVGTRRALMPEQILIPGLTLLLLTGMAWRSTRPLTASTATLIVSVLTFVVWGGTTYRGVLRPLYLQAFQDRSTGAGGLVERVSAGLPFVFVAVGSIVCQRGIPLVVAAGCSFADTAHFSYAMLVAGLPSLPLGILSLTLIPRFARHYHNGHLEESQRLARNASTMIFLTAVGLSAGLLIASPAIPWILGAPWRAVTTLLPALLLASLVDCLTGPTMPVMQTTGMERTYSCLFLVYVPVQLLLLYVLSQWAGVQGAAVAYLLGRCLWNLLVTTLIYRQRSLVMLPALESLREGLSKLRR